MFTTFFNTATIEFSWPEGLSGAMSQTWDDGQIYDRKLIDRMNHYGIKGSFNLNSYSLGRSIDEGFASLGEFVTRDEIKKLYQGHELALHTVHHPWMAAWGKDGIRTQLIQNKIDLESCVGYPIKGMALPFNRSSPEIRSCAKELGIKYIRGGNGAPDTITPEDFHHWQYNTNFVKYDRVAIEHFIKTPYPQKLFTLMGHSFEMERLENGWEKLEEILKEWSEIPNIWYATFLEIFEYIDAFKRLEWTFNGQVVKNPNAVDLYLRVNKKVIKIESGATISIV